MHADALFDPLFRLPFLTGLLVVTLLTLVGCYIRVRDEWLAALGFAQVSAAGALLAALAHFPPMAGALTVAACAAVIKGRLAKAGNDNFALMVLVGWSAALLVAKNVTRGEDLEHAFVDGQLYFSGPEHFRSALYVGLGAVLLLPWLSQRLLAARFFPDTFAANRVSGWRYHLLFDLLAAAALAVAATVLGVMATFAFVFVPSWHAFQRTHGWRRALGSSLSLSLGAYVLGFALAITTDQPFGPTAVATLLGLTASWTGIARLWAARHPHPRSEPGDEETV
jgi:zinc/manganese transport system permease protein